MAAGSVLVELFDSSDSIEDRLLKYTLAGGRLKEALRSRKQEKKVKNVRATGPNLNYLCTCLPFAKVARHIIYIERAHKYKTNSCISCESTVISNFAYI